MNFPVSLGLLEPPIVSDPVEYNDFNRILTWTPPFTLDITDVDPDITGYRICNNSANTCVDTTDTSILFETMCDPVEYDISACNRVGCGENATVTFPPGKLTFYINWLHVSTLMFASWERICSRQLNPSLLWFGYNFCVLVYIIFVLSVPIVVWLYCHLAGFPFSWDIYRAFRKVEG